MSISMNGCNFTLTVTMTLIVCMLVATDLMIMHLKNRALRFIRLYLCQSDLKLAN